MLVVKAGGRTLLANMDTILDDIAALAAKEEVILVHGGGDLVTEYSRRMGIEPRFVTSPSGVRSRYTDERELEVYTMVMAGLINKRLTAGLVARGVGAIGVSGVDAAILAAKRKKHILIIDERGRKRLIPGGYTGRIKDVNSEALRELVRLARVVVLSPLAIEPETGQLLNTDGDQAAARVAAALRADKLILLTDVDGVMLDGKLVEELDPQRARELAKLVGPGMNRKLIHAAEAVEAGVGEAIIGNGTKNAPIQRLLSGAKATRIRGSGGG
ncbi:MAG: [LysW]-aminoadipate/[LysW]-glutamate kinase [Crenarchaeota archaeon]|nr:[LysW]-aminoadipate/[LysW]-glutamate kinase [Thermoproteota archaeon]